jgi:hypothetical protein
VSARQQAEDWLDSAAEHKNPELANGSRRLRALVGNGWALLDLADAIREGREPTYSQVEFTTDADEAEPHPVGTDPLNS